MKRYTVLLTNKPDFYRHLSLDNELTTCKILVIDLNKINHRTVNMSIERLQGIEIVGVHVDGHIERFVFKFGTDKIETPEYGFYNFLLSRIIV